jgi:hypothetical protein
MCRERDQLSNQSKGSFLENFTAKCFALMKTGISVEQIMRDVLTLFKIHYTRVIMR